MKNSLILKSVLVTLLSVGGLATASLEKYIPAVHAYGAIETKDGKMLDVHVVSNPGRNTLSVSIFPSNQDGPREDQTTTYSIFEFNATYDVLTLKAQHTDIKTHLRQTFATLKIYTDFVTSSGVHNADLTIDLNNGHGLTRIIEANLTGKFDHRE